MVILILMEKVTVTGLRGGGQEVEDVGEAAVAVAVAVAVVAAEGAVAVEIKTTTRLC
jgi:hypothetical protein